MSDGHQKQRLTQYLTGANEKAIGDSGKDWALKGQLLQAVSQALQKKGPELSEKLGKDSLTAAELKSSLLASAASMGDTGEKLTAAGDALLIVGDNLEKARVSRKAMKTLVEPPPYTAPSYNGAQPTPEQIQQDADARGASNQQHGSYQAAYAGQEAEAAEITANLDQAFLSAIPPMMAIHGGPDPTAPTDDKDGPGTTAPPPVHRTATAGVYRQYGVFEQDEETDAERREREREEREREERQREREKAERAREERLREERAREERERLERERLERERLERERLERERLERLRQQETHDPVRYSTTTNVQGGTDSGASYHVVSDGSSASGSAGSTSAGVGGAAAAGAAGAGLGAGAMKGGAIGSSAAAPIGGTVRGIGAGGQPGAASSISRGSTGAGARGVASSGSSAASRSTAAGSASRSAGAGGRAGAAGSSSANRGSGGRAGSAGSTSGKGSAKGKGLFRRGANGSASGGRSNKKGDDRDAQRDALVYEQDWLGDETAAPSVLD